MSKAPDLQFGRSGACAALLGYRFRSGLRTWPKDFLRSTTPIAQCIRADRTATVIIAGLAFLQNLRRGYYELAVDLPAPLRVAAAFTELARAI
jgi:hypothetical protein